MRSSGTPIDHDFLISGGSGSQWSPDVAYNSFAGRYLVVWDDSNADFYGQMLEADGTLVGGSLSISAAPGGLWGPAVASSNSDEGFLVVWEDARNGTSNVDIYGRTVSSDGTSLGYWLEICTDAANQGAPAIAYAPSSGTDADTYLVVWHDERNAPSERDLYARPIYRTGVLGPEAPAVVAGANQEHPDVG